MISAMLFIVANAAYQAGLQFYDALLPEVTTEENRGRIGGIGVGIGYLGSYLAVGSGWSSARRTTRCSSRSSRSRSRCSRCRVSSSCRNAAIRIRARSSGCR